MGTSLATTKNSYRMTICSPMGRFEATGSVKHKSRGPSENNNRAPKLLSCLKFKINSVPPP